MRAKSLASVVAGALLGGGDHGANSHVERGVEVARDVDAGGGLCAALADDVGSGGLRLHATGRFLGRLAAAGHRLSLLGGFLGHGVSSVPTS